MQLILLEAYVNVIRFQSFSKAAKELYISQPTISTYIGTLEKELGVQLIIRSTKNLTPTRDGLLLYEYASNILSLWHQAKQEIGEAEVTQNRTIEVATSNVPAMSIIPHVLANISKDFPNLYFLISECNSDDVIKRVIQMECNVGIAESTFSRANCEFTQFYQDKLVVITPNTERFRKYDGNMPIEEIKSLPFVSRMLGSSTKIEYEMFLKSVGITNDKMSFVSRMYNTESVINAVKSGLGVSIVSKLAASEYLREEKILCFEYDSPLLYRNLYFVYRKNQILPYAVKLFMDYVKKYCDQFES